MSSNEYNLTDNVKDDFPFKIGSNHYVMRYPLVEEVERLQELVAKQQSLTDDEEKVNAGKATQEYMYSFTSPVTKDAPSITEALKKHNIKVLNNFNAMVQKEFGVK